jgi:hypothetical protein
MNYDEIDVEATVDAVVSAVQRGQMRPATKRESMAVRLAARSSCPSSIVHEMQTTLQNDKDLISA